MKIAFVTDTGTGQHPDYWKEKGIYCLPLQITCDGESKDEYTEITYSEVIQNYMRKGFKTSLPSLGKIQDCFEELKMKDMTQFLRFLFVEDYPEH